MPESFPVIGAGGSIGALQAKGQESTVARSSSPEAFVADMLAHADAHGLPLDGPIVAAVSGGADSVALGEALHLIGANPLHVVHVHHHLRAEADRDAEFVAQLAGQWSAEFHLEDVDTPARSVKLGVGIEEAAREGRYEALASAAASVDAPVVAVAHHADDQVETVLHRIARGTHLRGLAGMPARRQLSAGVLLIRPLLWARRAEIEAFCRARGLSWRDDATNASTDFTRNFIRHELLPLMRRRLNVRTDDAVLRLADAAGGAQATLDELAEDLYRRARRKSSVTEINLRIGPLRKAAPLLATMALRLALAELDAPERDLSRERFSDLEAVLKGDLSAADLPGGIHVEASGQMLRLTRQD